MHYTLYTLHFTLAQIKGIPQIAKSSLANKKSKLKNPAAACKILHLYN